VGILDERNQKLPTENAIQDMIGYTDYTGKETVRVSDRSDHMVQTF